MRAAVKQPKFIVVILHECLHLPAPASYSQIHVWNEEGKKHDVKATKANAKKEVSARRPKMKFISVINNARSFLFIVWTASFVVGCFSANGQHFDC